MSGYHIVNSYFASANGRVAASQGLYSGSGSARNAGIWEEEKTIKKKIPLKERRERPHCGGRDPRLPNPEVSRYECAYEEKDPVTGG